MSNRRAACSRHGGCFWAAVGVPRFDPRPEGKGAGVQNAGDAGSRWSPSGEDGVFFGVAGLFPCFPRAQQDEVGRSVRLVGLQKHGGHHAYLKWLVEKAADFQILISATVCNAQSP